MGRTNKKPTTKKIIQDAQPLYEIKIQVFKDRNMFSITELNGFADSKVIDILEDAKAHVIMMQ